VTTKRERPPMLLVDDDEIVRDVVERIASDEGFDVIVCADGHEALAAISRRPVFALTDLRMPGPDGLEVLRTLRDKLPSCSTVLMSGAASIDEAVDAIKIGATDYLHKPLDFDRLRSLLRQVREEAEARRSVLEHDEDVAKRLELCGMIGRSAVMQEIFSLIRRLAPYARAVLIAGETGTGKELVARAFHALGPRCERPFVPVSCSALVETFAETQLFGHERDAPAGATERKEGFFEQADRGTLFFDEIGEMPAGLQARLLRVLETGEVQRVGSTERRTVDVHVVAATNRDLRAEVDAGRFRIDLFYRLNTIELDLPPLRDRREDIPYLAATFIRAAGDRLRKSIRGISSDAERALMSCYWEGNVRELRNVIERACMVAEGDILSSADLLWPKGGAPRPVEVRSVTSRPRAEGVKSSDSRELPALEDVQRDHILSVLAALRGNKKAAAARLGISRRKLYRFLERYQQNSAKPRP
jgi:two-component system, NtrC family, response regulator HydG